jgi:hypothetical protein
VPRKGEGVGISAGDGGRKIVAVVAEESAVPPCSSMGSGGFLKVCRCIKVGGCTYTSIL